jgi:hypothetical protein
MNLYFFINNINYGNNLKIPEFSIIKGFYEYVLIIFLNNSKIQNRFYDHFYVKMCFFLK